MQEYMYNHVYFMSHCTAYEAQLRENKYTWFTALVCVCINRDKAPSGLLCLSLSHTNAHTHTHARIQHSLNLLEQSSLLGESHSDMRLSVWTGDPGLFSIFLLALLASSPVHVGANQQDQVKKREYYIAAVEIDWNYNGNDTHRSVHS